MQVSLLPRKRKRVKSKKPNLQYHLTRKQYSSTVCAFNFTVNVTELKNIENPL